MKTIRIDGPIGQEPGELSARWFRSQLPSDGSQINVTFHSEGGSVFEAFAIFDAVKAYSGRKTATVESMAFSAASLLLCAFDDVAISPNGYTMVHAPYFDSEELPKSERQLLDSLRERMIGIYSEKTGKPIATISKMVDEETFLDAESSISLGIVNRVARASSAVMARMPARILARIKAASPGASAKAKWAAAVRACGSASLADEKYPGLRQQVIREANKH